MIQYSYTQFSFIKWPFFLVTAGQKQRKVGVTNMNDRSSRSHTIFRIIIESMEEGAGAGTADADEGGEAAAGGGKAGAGGGRAIMQSHLNLVDLAGSERAAQTGAEGARFREGANINKSLMILGKKALFVVQF